MFELVLASSSNMVFNPYFMVETKNIVACFHFKYPTNVVQYICQLINHLFTFTQLLHQHVTIEFMHESVHAKDMLDRCRSQLFFY